MNNSASAFVAAVFVLISLSLTTEVKSSGPHESSAILPKEMAMAHRAGNYGALTKFLQSADPAERALAAIALRDFPYGGNAPHLMKLLNDDSQLEWGNTGEETSPSREAAKTLAVIERTRIGAKPGNIGALQKWFSLAVHGTALERRAAVQILGKLAEPLAVPLLSGISKGDPNYLPDDLTENEKGELRRGAAEALKAIGPKPWENRTPAALEQFAHLATAVGCLAIALIIGCWTAIRQRKEFEPVRLLASLIPVVLLAGFAVALYQEYRISGIGYQALIDSLLSGKSRCLARQLVMDRSDFPGDANAGQYLVEVGDPAVFDSVARLKVLKDDFTDKWKKTIQQRRQWIMARIVAEKLVASDLREFATLGGPEHRANVAATLADLGVRTGDIVAVLNSISADKNERVVDAAKKALSKVEKYPEWNGYPFLKEQQDG